MTFVAGMANSKLCVITAENMVTGIGPIRTSPGISSSGRSLSLDMNDSAFKVSRPRANCIVGLAGDSITGAEIIKQIGSAQCLETRDAFRTFFSNREPTMQRHVSLIIGFLDEAVDSTRMLEWNSSAPEKLDEGSFLCAGSGKPLLGDMPLDLVREILDAKMLTAQKGAVLSFWCNQKLFHSAGKQLNRLGVEGCFFSFGLEAKHFMPQEDTAILRVELIPALKGFHIPIIKLAFRRGILFVNSSLSKQKTALANSINCDDEVVAAFDEHGGNALRALAFDFDDIWDLSNVRNVEIHFEFDNIPSQFRACAPGELLGLDETGTGVTINGELEQDIRGLIESAR